VIAFLTTLPYLLASFRTPTGFVFSGVLTAYDDTFSYFAWMRQGANLQVLMCDPFTSEPQPCEFFLPLWSLLGVLSRASGLSIPLTFHAVRLLSGLLLLVLAKSVAGLVMKSRTRLKYTLWLYATSSGLGWLIFGLKNRRDFFGGAAGSGSVDLDLPEAIAFRSFFAQVHFCIGVALVSAAIALFFKAVVEKKSSRAFVAGLLSSLLAVIHPYMVVVVCGVSAAALLLLPLSGKHSDRINAYRSSVPTAVAFYLGVVPGVGYLIYLNRSNEVLREWLRVTDTFSPSAWEYVLGFGIVGAVGLVGLYVIWSHYSRYGRLLSIWIAVQALLLYFPVSFQRRFVEGLQLPLSIAASAALFAFANKTHKKTGHGLYRSAILAGAIVLASLTNVGFLAGQLAGRGAGTGANDPRRYLSEDVISAFDWLRTESAPETVLFSSYLTGNIAPSMTGMRAFLGHYAQTLRSDEKGPLVNAFYTNTASDAQIRKIFTEHRVRYVFYGPFERAISDDFVPAPWLRLSHRVGDVMIFELPKQFSVLESQ
jgi:hypothetical protein